MTDQLDFIFNIYRFEEERLASYKYWPSINITPEKLAAAGFYYTGEADRVKCFECGIEMFDWVEGDNPMTDQLHWRSSCKFVRKQQCGNVPIGIDPRILQSRSRDLSGRYVEDYQPNVYPDFRNGQNEFQRKYGLHSTVMTTAKPKGPSHPEYARLQTFLNWPKSMHQTKEKLGDAGFYYTRRNDEMQCYHCGSGLKNWEPQDDR